MKKLLQSILCVLSISLLPSVGMASEVNWYKIVANDDITAVQDLIADGLDVNQPDSGEKVPLHYAAEGSLDMVKMLVQQGADIDLLDRWRQTAAMIAANADKMDIAHYLIKAGSNPNIISYRSNSFLTLAANKDDLALAELLIAHKADPAVTYKPFNGTALNKAIRKGNPAMVRLFLENGAKSVVSHVDDSNNSPLTILVSSSDGSAKFHQIAQMLVDAGADKSFKTTRGLTAYNLATRKKDAQLAEILK